MHDIWNPWHGCKKCSEGCQNCYMYFLDKDRKIEDSSVCFKTNSFNYPIQKDRHGNYKIKSGEKIRVCLTSDFFLEDADKWREDAWNLMRERKDVAFFLLTKRPQRVKNCLPDDFGDGWENIFFSVTCENQKRADERIPIMVELPFKHKGIMTAPLLEKISIEKYLSVGQIEQVLCTGENYDGSRKCDFEWVKNLSDECKKHDVTFAFLETGTHFVKDGREYIIKSKSVQSQQAYKSGLSFSGKAYEMKLTDNFGIPLTENEKYKPFYSKKCSICAGKIICNGCSKDCVYRKKCFEK